MAQIDDFKANLVGGGYRANQFRVTITPPAGIATARTHLYTTASSISIELVEASSMEKRQEGTRPPPHH